MDQLLGGLVRKAFKAAGAVASGLAKVLPLGRIFGLLRPLVQPLLKRVLDTALGKLARAASRSGPHPGRQLGLGEDETTDAFALGEIFDHEFAQLLLAPTDGSAGELLAELEAEAAAPGPRPAGRARPGSRDADRSTGHRRPRPPAHRTA